MIELQHMLSGITLLAVVLLSYMINVLAIEHNMIVRCGMCRKRLVCENSDCDCQQ